VFSINIGFTASRKVAPLAFHSSAASNGEGIWCLDLGKRSDGLWAVGRFERRTKGTEHQLEFSVGFMVWRKSVAWRYWFPSGGGRSGKWYICNFHF